MNRCSAKFPSKTFASVEKQRHQISLRVDSIEDEVTKARSSLCTIKFSPQFRCTLSHYYSIYPCIRKCRGTYITLLHTLRSFQTLACQEFRTRAPLSRSTLRNAITPCSHNIFFSFFYYTTLGFCNKNN